MLALSGNLISSVNQGYIKRCLESLAGLAQKHCQQVKESRVSDHKASILLAKIFKRFKARDAAIAPLNKHTGDAVSIWRDTGQVYYLENTLKLTFQSNSGAITIEKMSLESLPRVLKELQNLGGNSSLEIKFSLSASIAWDYVIEQALVKKWLPHVC